MNAPSPATDHSPFKPAAEAVPQDWPRLASYLAGQGLQLDTAATPRQFAGGFANLNYLVLIDGREAVLRRPPMGPLPPGAYDMGREHRILSRLHEQFPLAPRGLHHCDDATVLGAPFQLTEFRRGLSVRDELPAAWATQAGIGARLSKLLVQTLAELHRVDPAAVGLDSLGKPEGFLGRAVDGWRKRAALAFAISPAQQPLLDAVGAWLGANPVPDRDVTLLHNDFKLDNLLLSADGLQPVALLDWDQGTRGDGLFDLATLLSYWTQADDPAELQAMRQMPSAQPGFMTRREVIEAYAQASGRDLSEFRFHLSLANLKTAVIFQQLYQRYHSGETLDPRYAGFEGVAAALLQRAHDVAHHGIS
ncbi:MAG TPA: phosphotransferase family protein [Solimonas sp.]